jgi:valyl-tRNA synthetase
VLASVLEGILRLMHPMIPFITERLWWQLNAIRPTRGLSDRLECPPSPRLIHAHWPTPGKSFEDADFFPKIQEIVEAIRRVRNDYKVDPKKPVAVSIAAAVESKQQIDANREVIELLAVCTLGKVETDLPAPIGAARATAAGVELFIEGIIDPEADKLRKTREIETLTKKREALIARLANPSYADKAPAKLVQQTRDELAAAEAELAKLMQ